MGSYDLPADLYLAYLLAYDATGAVSFSLSSDDNDGSRRCRGPRGRHNGRYDDST